MGQSSSGKGTKPPALPQGYNTAFTAPGAANQQTQGAYGWQPTTGGASSTVDAHAPDRRTAAPGPDLGLPDERIQLQHRARLRRAGEDGHPGVPTPRRPDGRWDLTTASGRPRAPERAACRPKPGRRAGHGTGTKGQQPPAPAGRLRRLGRLPAATPSVGWSGAGVNPAFMQAHRDQKQQMMAQRAAGEQIPVNTAAIDQQAALQAMGLENFDAWKAPSASMSGQPQDLSWAPQAFQGENLQGWQQNWNALPPALRVAYGSALQNSGSQGSQLLRDIMETQGASTGQGADFINKANLNGVNYAIQNGQLVMNQKNPDGTSKMTQLANLADPTASRIIGNQDPAYKAILQQQIARSAGQPAPTF